jgi:hypothetical protein
MDATIAELKAQKRNTIYGYDGAAKNYFLTGTWTLDGLTDKEGKPISVAYDEGPAAPNVTASVFTLPLPTEDAVFNKHLLEEAKDVDVRELYKYNF